MSLALVFPGQGARELDQAVGEAMARPRGRELLSHAAREAGLGGLEALLARGGRALERTEVGQPVLAAVCLAALEREGLAPSIVLGHSLGELIGWCVSRAVPAEGAVSLVASRALAMARACAERPGAMLAVAASPEAIEAALALGRAAGHASIAAYNGPRETVIAGELAAVRVVERALGGVRLRTAGAFHTPLMAAACEPFAEALAAVSAQLVGAPTIHVAWATSPEVAAPSGLAEERRYLTGQLVAPLDFGRAIARALELGADELVVLGPPSPVLAALRRVLAGRAARLRVLARAA